MINFNVPPFVGKEIEYIKEAVENQKICGDGKFTKKCSLWIEQNINTKKCLLTTSCTHALEMAALLIDIKEGDEVIMPSYTFVSTANAFAMYGAKIIFVDIRPDTMNIDETKIEEAITNRTKAIVPVHYAGVACEMDEIMRIAEKYNLYVIEDAAQGIMSTYKGRILGTIGHLGCYSFHETKNVSMGEGGALLINNQEFIERAEIIREKGTNRSKFFRGEIDKYTWVDKGSSYLPGDINAAYLWAQLEKIEEITKWRIDRWNEYYKLLMPLSECNIIKLPIIPSECLSNGHMFYIKVKDLQERSKLIEFLRVRDVYAVFHYIPLHSSLAGRKYGKFCGYDVYTTKESECLLRLPMYYGLSESEVVYICEQVYDFFRGNNNDDKGKVDGWKMNK